MILLSFATDPARACTFDPPPALVLDPSSADDVPPAPPEVGEPSVTRGHGQDGKDCGDLGSILIPVDRPPGDPDGEDDVGYRLRLVDGALPVGVELPADAAAPWLGPELVLRWSDGGEAFEATLAVAPVDRAGNEGESVEVVVADRGCGCAVDGGRAGGLGIALGALLVLARRR